MYDKKTFLMFLFLSGMGILIYTGRYTDICKCNINALILLCDCVSMPNLVNYPKERKAGYWLKFGK